MRNRTWKVSVLKRLIVSFIIILTPLYLLSAFIYNNGRVILREELSNSMASQVSFYMEGLEKEIQRIRTLQFELVNDIDINRMATIPQALSNIEKTERLLRIQNRLFALKNSSIYIESVTIFLPAAGKQVSNQSINNFSEEEYKTMLDLPSSPEEMFIQPDGSIYLNLPYPLWYMTHREPLFLISVKLSKPVFKAALATMQNKPGEGIVFLDTDSGVSISTDWEEAPNTVTEIPDSMSSPEAAGMTDGTDQNRDTFYHEILTLIKENVAQKINNAEVAVIDGKRYLIVFRTSRYFHSVLCKYVPEESVFATLEKYSVWFFVFTGTALIVIVVYSVYVYKFIHKPLSRLVDSFKKVKTGDFKIHIEHRHDDEFRFIYSHFNSMVKDLEILINQAYTQKLLIQKAEMKQLQSQINPHFLYSSFFILNTMARVGDYENLEKFTEQLGKYFQFITRNAADEVTLAKETDHARVYTEIQAMRYSNRIKVDFEELPPEYTQIIVPRLILQPIIENAFEHGLGSKQAGGILRVFYEKAGEIFNIIVENNGEELDKEKMDMLQSKLIDNKDSGMEITALQNIHQRLKLKFGEEYGLSFKKGDSGGVRVIISVPLKG